MIDLMSFYYVPSIVSGIQSELGTVPSLEDLIVQGLQLFFVKGQVSGSQMGTILTSGNIWQCLEIFLVVKTGVGGG